MNKILVIKHGALGDIVLALPAFKAIRAHHPRDHIVLLTTAPYAEFLRQSGYFDEIWIDNRTRLYQWFAFFRLLARIRRARFARVYDLQSSERTAWYHFFLGRRRPEWVGTAAGASHRHVVPEGVKRHAVDRQKEQLALAGIGELGVPDLDWLTADIHRFGLKKPYALLVAGGSSHRPGKRWPAHHYGELCHFLAERGVTPVLIGTKTEAPVLSVLDASCPSAHNLSGRTSFSELAELARGAKLAVGNDTGPMHLIAATGCPTLVLFSSSSDPILCAPRGSNVRVLREARLADLPLATVIQAAETLL